MRNRMLKRLLCSLLLITLFLISSCASDRPDSSGETSKSETQADTPDSVAGDCYIVKDGVTDYYIIRSDYTSDAIVSTAVGLRRAIVDATGAEPGISTDWEKNPVYPHEIIVGETLREANAPIVDRIALGKTGYIIKEVDGKIYIAGGADEGTALGCDYFIDTFVKRGTELKIPVGYERIVYHEYDIPELYIAMTRVDASYGITIPTGSGTDYQEAAERLQQALYEKTGVLLEISEGNDDTPNAFVLSDATLELTGIYDITIKGTSMVLKSSASTGIGGCVDRFIALYLDGKYGRFNFPAEFEYLDLGDDFIIRYPDSYEQ